MQGARETADLGRLAQAGNLTDAAALLEQGRFRQQHRQAELEAPYQEFLRRQGELQRSHHQAGLLFSDDQARRLQGGQQHAQLGRFHQAANLADVANLQEQGRTQQQHQQSARDIAYQDFLRQQDVRRDRLAAQGAIMHGIQVPAQQTTLYANPAQPQVNTMGQLGSLAGTLYGARMFAGHKRGGHIQRRPPRKPAFGLSGLRLRTQSAPSTAGGR